MPHELAAAWFAWRTRHIADGSLVVLDGYALRNVFLLRGAYAPDSHLAVQVVAAYAATGEGCAEGCGHVAFAPLRSVPPRAFAGAHAEANARAVYYHLESLLSRGSVKEEV